MVAGLARRGLGQVLCEGGPTLFGTILAADRVDELCLTVSPVLESGTAGRITNGTLAEPLGLTLDQVLVSDGTLMLRYLRAAVARLNRRFKECCSVRCPDPGARGVESQVFLERG